MTEYLHHNQFRGSHSDKFSNSFNFSLNKTLNAKFISQTDFLSKFWQFFILGNILLIILGIKIKNLTS